MRVSDRVFMAYGLFVAALCVARADALPGWWAYALAHVALGFVPWALARFERPGWRSFVRDWDGVALVPVLFILAMRIVHPINPHDWDARLARWDDAIGGLALLRSMAAIERPWLTDAMKLAWMSYYFLPLIVGGALWRMDRDVFLRAKNAFVVGWLATFVLYFAMPARGPGWLAGELDVPQPRWDEGAVSRGAKRVIEALEPPHPRHTFPSGHVMVAALGAWLLVRHRRWSFALVVVPLAAGVVFSTVYLRYHYVIDVIAGLAMAAACALLAREPAPTMSPRREEETVH